MNLQDATKIIVGDEKYSALVDPEWCIWGPIGGYIAAIALRATGHEVPSDHRPVTFTCQFLAKGEPGNVDILVESLKSGSTSFQNVQISQKDRILLQAQVCTTAKVDGPESLGMKAPSVPEPEKLEAYAAQLERYGHKPLDFWKNVDGRQVDFRLPGDPDPRGCRTECWFRFEEWETASDPFLDGARALILIDTNIWRAYNRGQSQLPEHVAPSLDLTVWFHQATPKSRWLLAEASADIAHSAILNGNVRVWSDDGSLAASGGSQCLFLPIKK